jgi:hypothetical protein
MTTPVANLQQMPANGNYPVDPGGITMSQSSGLDATFANPMLMNVSFAIAGSLGGAAVYQGQVLTRAGNWVNVMNMASEPGLAAVLSAIVEGVAFRVNASNTAGQGVGANTPVLALDIKKLNLISTGDR